jgi:chromosomal replication initiator protein
MEARSPQEIWEAALGELQIQVSGPNYQTWLKKTVGLGYQDNQFVVGVPNSFIAEYLDKNQRSLIERTLGGLTHPDIKVLFQVNGSHPNSPGGDNAQEETLVDRQNNPPRFNPNYTFASFIVGSCNQLAHAAALGVAENPGHGYNPLFIYGGVGLGKTHLLHAIGNTALASNTRVLYVSAEQFTNEFVNAIREKETKEFRNKYRSADMLLIDDVHFISGKKQTEESLFHTFNELYSANHQIALTSDCPPKAIPSLAERLRSRFEGGLVAGIQPPDFETRLAILEAKAKHQKVSIPSDVLQVIAHRKQQSIRELEGSLNRVTAYAKLVGAPFTPKLATEALKDIGSKNSKEAYITINLTIKVVADSFQVVPLQLKDRKGDKETTLARQVAMYLLRQETDYSLAEIGRELGGRRPSTVIHACEKIAHNMDASPFLKHKILDIQQKILQEQDEENH